MDDGRRAEGLGKVTQAIAGGVADEEQYQVAGPIHGPEVAHFRNFRWDRVELVEADVGHRDVVYREELGGQRAQFVSVDIGVLVIEFADGVVTRAEREFVDGVGVDAHRLAARVFQ